MRNHGTIIAFKGDKRARQPQSSMDETMDVSNAPVGRGLRKMCKVGLEVHTFRRLGKGWGRGRGKGRLDEEPAILGGLDKKRGEDERQNSIRAFSFIGVPTGNELQVTVSTQHRARAVLRGQTESHPAS